MASIARRDGSYQVRWRDPDGKQRARSVPTHDAAKRLGREIEECVSAGRRWEPRDARPLPELRAVAEAWLRHLARRGRAPRTLELYAQRLELWLAWLPTTDTRRRVWAADCLSRANLEGWFDHLIATKRAASAARKYLEAVELMWLWAASRDDEWTGIPAPRRVTTEIPRPQPVQRVAPTWEEMAACVRTLEGWHRHVAVLLYYTGLRVQQAMMLRWDDVDLDRAELRIRPELGKTPSERRGRTIPISRHLVGELDRWPRDSAFLVPSGRMVGPREREARSRDARRGWTASGVRKAVWSRDPWHCFRAGWQSGILREGGGWLASEYYIGHKLPATGESYVDPILALGLVDLVALVPELVDLPEGWSASLTTRRGYQGQRAAAGGDVPEVFPKPETVDNQAGETP